MWKFWYLLYFFTDTIFLYSTYGERSYGLFDLKASKELFEDTCMETHTAVGGSRHGNQEVIQDLISSGWFIEFNSYNLTGLCNIDKWEEEKLSQDSFVTKYSQSLPVIITVKHTQQGLKDITRKQKILQMYGNYTVTLATANTHSYRKVDMVFSKYVEKYVKPQSLEVDGKDTLYLFGDNDRVAWKELFDSYLLPPYSVPKMLPELSFGIAGPGSGVPFHIHGPTFAETIYGRKRWFLYPPSAHPNFDPDTTTLHWFLNIYPHLDEANRPYECTLFPGEILYIPSLWWHATLNVDTTVFMSTFFTPNY